MNKKFIYHEINNSQDILSSLQKYYAETFCCIQLEIDTTMLVLYFRVREYDEITAVLIDSRDTDIVVMCISSVSLMVNLL